MFYTFVWSSPGNSIHENVPLKALCDSVTRSRSQQYLLNIVFLEGMEHVPVSYLESLKQPQVNLINYETEFNKIKNQYRTIFNSYSRFESYCFLRWICLKEIVQNENVNQVWHIDSDVVLHISLDDLAQDTIGKTFMLEGCPVLASISNMNWFLIYEQELKKLLKNPVAYSNLAFKNKAENLQNDMLLCNQSNYRNPIGSDQDLLQFLIGSRVLPQENAEQIFSGHFFYIQNPLHLDDWNTFQGSVFAGSFTLNNGKVIVNDKRQLAFTHFQGNFSTFCNLFYFLHKLKLPPFIIKRILQFEINNEKFKISKIAFVIRVFINRARLALKRDKLVKQFTTRENYYLLKVLNFLASMKAV